ncbi:DUF4180 domain-containing protein [Mucilaginibacter conchicola]|uniref:DUF4180 domain-containing protein n=1 Tax=Mucilaginibacter conchicola TaxID=2303333 RepID=A0A372NZI4_9SPHI|nr:DUF4180 domain-containing protein [Mucilaginibacter conchicola]RFZ95535.1 DUF4180 domain-containing protein [Mucilaginibacter conchicola]
MNIISHTINNKEIAEVSAERILIQSIEDALDLIGNIYYQGFDAMIVYEKNLTPDFFELKNKLAGEVLQKFTNYRMRLAVVGEFSKFDSKSLNDFIYESNKGKQVNFAGSIEEALEAMAK